VDDASQVKFPILYAAGADEKLKTGLPLSTASASPATAITSSDQGRNFILAVKPGFDSDVVKALIVNSAKNISEETASGTIGVSKLTANSLKLDTANPTNRNVLLQSLARQTNAIDMVFKESPVGHLPFQ
jgi:hypothetical protein